MYIIFTPTKNISNTDDYDGLSSLGNVANIIFAYIKCVLFIISNNKHSKVNCQGSAREEENHNNKNSKTIGFYFKKLLAPSR